MNAKKKKKGWKDDRELEKVEDLMKCLLNLLFIIIFSLFVYLCASYLSAFEVWGTVQLNLQLHKLEWN